jgi:hypothetical protein
MHAQQTPGQRLLVAIPHQDRRAAGAAMRARIGQEIALTLEAHAERRRDGALAHDGQVMQRVVEAQREANYTQRTADADLIQRALQMGRRERIEDAGVGQITSVQFEHRDVDVSPRVGRLTPYRAGVSIQRHGVSRGPREIVAIDVELDLDAIGKMLAGLVDHHVAARDQMKPPLAFEEKSARVRERLRAEECGDPRRGEQHCLGHSSMLIDQCASRRPSPAPVGRLRCAATLLTTAE